MQDAAAVLRDTLAVLHSIFITKDDHILKAMAYSLCERLHRNEKDEEPKIPPPKLQALPITQASFPTAGHILVSKNRVLYSHSVQ